MRPASRHRYDILAVTTYSGEFPFRILASLLSQTGIATVGLYNDSAPTMPSKAKSKAKVKAKAKARAQQAGPPTEQQILLAIQNPPSQNPEAFGDLSTRCQQGKARIAHVGDCQHQMIET